MTWNDIVRALRVWETARLDNSTEDICWQGLCGWVSKYIAKVAPFANDIEIYCGTVELLRKRFAEDGLHQTYPFNASDDNYGDEIRYSKTHLNPKRIAWVQKILKEYSHVL